MKKQGKTLVSRKPNKIIEARQGLSVVQHRILFAVLSKFRTKIANTELKTPQNYLDFIRTRYEINLSDIIPDIKKLKAKEGSELCNHVEKECKKIMDQKHEVKTDDGWKIFTLIDFAEFHKEKMKLEIKIAESMIFEILMWYKNGYTQIPLKEVIPLRSKYSIRIFELLLRVMNIPDVKENGYTISYEELRKKLGIMEKEYKIFRNFNVRVLRQAQKEIHEKTFMRFGYEKEKEFFTRQLNIRFFDITHKVKEILPTQTTLFDFEKMEENNDQQVADNSKKILDFKEDLYKQIDADNAKKKEKKTKYDAYSKQPDTEKFTDEQEKKLDKYLDGIFSADDIKSRYEFDYIEFYYRKAMEKNDKGTVKDFAGFLYSLISKDSYRYYELKEKKKRQEEEKIAKEKLEREKKREKEQAEKRQREQDAANKKRWEALFDSFDAEKKKTYLEKLYLTNDLYKSFDQKNISEVSKWAIGAMIDSEQKI